MKVRLPTENQQLNAIRDQAIRRLSIIDLNINGNDVNSDEDFVKIGYSATKNKVLFWLKSSLGDVVRSEFSSPLIRLINKPLTDDNAREYTSFIRNEFDSVFNKDDIYLQNITLIPDKINKVWKLQLIVLDNVTDSSFDFNLEIK